MQANQTSSSSPGPGTVDSRSPPQSSPEEHHLHAMQAMVGAGHNVTQIPEAIEESGTMSHLYLTQTAFGHAFQIDQNINLPAPEGTNDSITYASPRPGMSPRVLEAMQRQHQQELERQQQMR